MTARMRGSRRAARAARRGICSLRTAQLGKDRRGANIDRRWNPGKNVSAELLGVITRRSPSQKLALSILEGLEQELQHDGTGDFDPILTKLEGLEQATGETYAAGAALDQLVSDLNGPSHPAFWVIQSRNPHELRPFSK